MASYDIIGNVVIFKFPDGMRKSDKIRIAEDFLCKHKQVTTALEKTTKISGRLRTPKTRFIAGYKTKEAVYRENGCVFRLNVDSCYFSPRLAGERKELAEKTGRKESVIVMFGGVAPFAVVIAKTKKAGKVLSVELNRACLKYALENIKENKVGVEAVQGDVRRVCGRMKEKFDRIVMARPNLEDSFLDVAFKLAKKGSVIHYYGFYEEERKQEMIDLINDEAKKARKKIKIQKIKKAGDIGVRTFRYRVDFKVLT